MEFYENFWLRGKRDFFRLLWQAIRIPLISGIVVLVIWSPVVLDYINSLSLGLVTGQEAIGNALVNSTTWIMNSYDLYMSLPWIILGFIEIIWLIPLTYRNRSLKIIFAWSTLCIVWGIILAPLSYLSSRFLMMTPIWILVPFGMVRVLQMTQHWHLWQRAIQQILLLAVVFGVVLPGNIIFNVKKLNYEMYHVSINTIQRINYVNQFITSEQVKPPYIFLVEKSTSDSVAYSSLWRVILLSTLPDQALTNSYLYFGTLNHLLNKEPTPPTAEGLPAVDQASFAASSKLWFDVLTKYKVLSGQEMTIFIMKEYNPDTFDQYLYLPEVDSIGPDILVINVPNDLKY